MVSPRHPSTIENLPGEVLSDIFIRLLAKQLAQMRSVCKSWNALLSDSSFIKSHLSRSLANNDRILLLFHMGYLFDDNSFTARLTHSPNLELANFIKVPVNLQSKNVRVIGSVNGLICFFYKTYREGNVVHIWNPSLSVVLTLPPCYLPTAAEGNPFRFGYDPKTDDYKVVKLTAHSRPFNVLPEVEVYSMRKGSWELITQSFPSHITMIKDHDHVCADGHDGRLHWLGFGGLKLNLKTIVAFDLGAETFHEIPLPHSILHHHESRYHYLGVLGGKLCAMSRVVKNGEWELWVMDKYGVAESWVQHHVFSQFSGDIVPYGFTSDNKFLFQLDRDCVGLYDADAAINNTFKINGGQFGLLKVVEYVDSLVWVAPAKGEMNCGYKKATC